MTDQLERIATLERENATLKQVVRNLTDGSREIEETINTLRFEIAVKEAKIKTICEQIDRLRKMVD